MKATQLILVVPLLLSGCDFPNLGRDEVAIIVESDGTSADISYSGENRSESLFNQELPFSTTFEGKSGDIYFVRAIPRVMGKNLSAKILVNGMIADTQSSNNGAVEVRHQLP